MLLSEFVRQYCNKHQVSISQLANHANMSRSTLYNMMENDSSKKNTTLINLTKLAIAMQVHPQFLIQLEWQKYQLAGNIATPINPLIEPDRCFTTQTDNSHFISETIPDGSLVTVNETFVKTWRLQNTGKSTWKDRWLVCQNLDDSIQHQPLLSKFTTERSFYIQPSTDRIAIPTTAPGEIVDLSVELTAPNTPATAFSYWKMVDKHGEICFPNSIGVYVQVQVISAGCAKQSTDRQA